MNCLRNSKNRHSSTKKYLKQRSVKLWWLFLLMNKNTKNKKLFMKSSKSESTEFKRITPKMKLIIKRSCKSCMMRIRAMIKDCLIRLKAWNNRLLNWKYAIVRFKIFRARFLLSKQGLTGLTVKWISRKSWLTLLKRL
jgi:hypothetical protein